MHELELINEYRWGIRNFVISLTYPENDIRREFFAMAYDNYLNFYHGLVTMVFANEVAAGNVGFHERIHYMKEHVSNLSDLGAEPILNESLFSSINKQIVLGMWTAFELSITVLAESILTESEKDELKSIKLSDILTILKANEVTDSQKSKLSKILSDKNMSMLPAWRKFNALLKSCSDYKRDKKQDIEYIKFYSTMRNCISHSNSIFHGNDFDFAFKGYEFRFVNGKEYKHTFDPNLLSHLFIDLGNELIDIYSELIKEFDSFQFISYPDIVID